MPPADEAEIPRRLLVLSDLHLSVGPVPHGGTPEEAFLDDHRLAALVDRCSQGREAVDSILLLGDVFELPGGAIAGRRCGAEIAIEVDVLLNHLEQIAAAHREVFTALSRFVERGGHLHFVAGNHDPAVSQPHVAELLTRLISGGSTAGEGRGRIVVHPWTFFVPGLLYAEHGHVHHVINAPLDPSRQWRPGPPGSGLAVLDDPVGAELHRLSLRPRDVPWWGLRPAWSVLRSFAANTWRQLRSGAVSPLPVDDQGAPPSVLSIIRHEARPGPLRTIRHVLSKVWRGVTGSHAEPGHDLHSAAASVHGHLSAVGENVPVYVFGHSHRPERRDLDEDAVLLNVGSWSSWPGQLGSAPVRRPYGLIRRDGRTVRAELRWVEASEAGMPVASSVLASKSAVG